MAETAYYDSSLTGAELDEALRNLGNLSDGVDAAKQAARQAEQAAEEARTWAGQAGTAATGALGWYQTPQALAQAYPAAQNGQWALVGDTASLWLWSGVAGAFVDSTGRLYTATLLLDGWQGEGPYTQTAALTPLDGGGPVTENSLFVSGPMAQATGNADSDAALLAALNQLNQAVSVSPGSGTVTVTLNHKPTVDLPAVWQIREV